MFNDEFKFALDKFLSNIPDEPNVTGEQFTLRACNKNPGRPFNSVIEQVNLCILGGCRFLCNILVIRLAFSPRDHEICSQEILKVIGNTCLYSQDFTINESLGLQLTLTLHN